MTTIIPAILPKTRNELVEKLRQLSDADYSGRVQIDLCDGVFVESITWPFAEYGGRDQFLSVAHDFEIDTELFDLLHQFKIDYDLMVADPEHLFTVWNQMKPEHIIIHLDSVTDTEALAIDLSAEHSPFGFVKNKHVILAISQTTRLDEFADWYHDVGIRHVQIMGIDHIGRQGESFSDNTLMIIQEMQKRFPDIVIQVDGGVNLGTIKKLTDLDIDAVVVGSAVFVGGDIHRNLEELQKYAIL